MIVNGSQSSPVAPGQLLRLAIREAPLESILSPTLSLRLQSWRERMTGWAETLADTGAAVIPVSAPSVGGDALAGTQTLVLDVRTRVTDPPTTAGPLLRQIERTIPLGADLAILDLKPAETGSESRGRARDDLADSLASSPLARFLPSVGLPPLPAGTGTVVLLLLVAGAVFLIGRGLKDARGAVS